MKKMSDYGVIPARLSDIKIMEIMGGGNDGQDFVILRVHRKDKGKTAIERLAIPREDFEQAIGKFIIIPGLRNDGLIEPTTDLEE